LFLAITGATAMYLHSQQKKFIPNSRD